MGIFTKKTRTPAEVQADIMALNESIAAKESAIRSIDEQVRAAVGSGDMKAADELDGDLIRERMALDRLRGRNAILADALAAAEEDAANESAQFARDKALAAQTIGHALLSDYEKQAKALASTLEKLAAIDRFIERTNHRTEGRAEPVESVYRATRYKPAVLVDGVERWYEYPGHGPAHPELDPWLSRDGSVFNPRAPEPLQVGHDERNKPIYVEAVLMKRNVPNAIVAEHHVSARPIDEMVVLPGSKIDDIDLWNETRRREAQIRHDEIVGLLLTSKRSKAA